MRRLIGPLAVSAALAAGCGGDDETGSLSRAEFTERVEAICADRQDAVRKMDDEQTPEGLKKAFGQELDDLAGIEPPADLASQWSRYVALMKKSAADQDRWMKAASSSDPDVRSGDAFHEPYTRWQRNGAQARKIAKVIGLETCGEHIY